MAKVVWGIELGTASIKAVKLQQVKENLEIIDLDVMELPPTPEGVEQTREDRLGLALSSLKDKHKITNEPVFISIPGHQSFNKMISLPLLDPKKFRDTVKYEAQQQMPIPMDQINWDFQLMDKNPKVGDEVQVSLFAVRSDIVNTYLNVMDTANINVTGVQVAPLAIYNFVKYDQKFPKSGVVVDIGADNTDVIIIDENKIFVRNVPSGGSAITKVLAEKFKIPFEEAEKLKIKAAKSAQADKIFIVMKPALRDLLGEINRSLGFYKSQNPKVKLNYMLLMGSGSHLLGLKKFFEQQLQFRVDKLQHLKRLQLGRQANPEILQNNIATLSVAMGLAGQAIGAAENRINLVPPVVKTRELTRRKFPIAAACAVAMFLSAFFPLVGVAGVAKKGAEAEQALKAANGKLEENKTKFAAIKGMDLARGELSRYEEALRGYNLTSLAEEVLIQVAQTPEIVAKVRAYNQAHTIFPTDDTFEDFFAILDKYDNSPVDDTITRDHFREAFGDAYYTLKLDFAVFDKDGDNKVKKDEIRALLNTPANKPGAVRSQPLILELAPITRDNFPSLHLGGGAKFWSIDDRLETTRLVAAVAPAEGADPNAAAGAVSMPAGQPGEMAAESKPAWFYRQREYGAQLILAIPIDHDYRDKKGGLSALMGDIQDLLKKQLSDTLAATVKNLPGVFYDIGVNTVVANGQTKRISEWTGRQASSNQPELVVNQYRLIALGVRLGQRGPNIGQVVRGSTTTTIVAEFPAEYQATLSKPDAANRLFTVMGTSSTGNPGVLKLKLDANGVPTARLVQNNRAVRIEFVPAGPFEAINQLVSAPNDWKVYAPGE